MNNIVVDSKEDKGQVSIPIPKSELGDFITSLLGQTQSIEREQSANHDIDHSWLCNLHYTLDQRITQQAESKNVLFNATVFFDDGYKRTFTDFASFEAYKESKNLTSIGIRMLWKYLVKLPHKEFPEQQQISFLVIDKTKTKNGSTNEMGEETLNSIILGHVQKGYIRYQIDHTERTWGDDIESVITNALQEVTNDKSSQISKLFLFRLFLFAALAISGLYISEVYSLDQREILLSEIAKINSDGVSPPVDLLHQKFDLLLESKPYYTGPTIKMAISFVFFLVGMAAFILTKINYYSYVLLTKPAYDRKDRLIKKEGWKKFAYAMSFICSIAASIIATLIYTNVISV